MLPNKTTTLLIFFRMTISYGWPPSNYSKSSATYGIGALDDEVDWSRHPCKRECKDNEPPMTCRYGFTIENYATMSKACYNCPFNVTDCFRPHCLPADGNLRVVIVVNRRLPGPSIEVCKNDRIIVDVKNMLNGESTTIHWHGLHQRGTPFMDGVPMVSQCPIAAGDSFRYDFIADNAGTHWWHLHSGVQRADGLFGGLIVRSPPSLNFVGHLYDYDEHLIILNEWGKLPISESYPLRHYTGIKLMDVHSIFVNGLGRYEDNNNKSSLIPRTVFHVRKGTRHRFHVISAVSYECTLSITVDQHPLSVISTDGGDVEPVEVDFIRMVPGERYDFVLNADREIDNYWIRISGGSTNCEFKHQEAILRYEGAADTEPSEPIDLENAESGKRILNPVNQGSETNGAMCISCSLTSVEPDDQSLIPIPDHQFYLNLDVYFLDNADDYRKNLYDTSQGNYNNLMVLQLQYITVPLTSASYQLDRLSFKMPDFPLQTQPELIKAGQLCNVTEARCTREQCSCPYVHQIKLNGIVEMVFVSEATYKSAINFKLPHSMHLHGFYYRVLAMERLNKTTSIETVKAWDQAGKIHRKLKGAPLKDVLDVPNGGYVVVRFRADNPGYWFMHCHFETHTHNGMAMVLKIGEHENFPPVPKNFPKCHYNALMGNSGVTLPITATALQLCFVLLVFITFN